MILSITSFLGHLHPLVVHLPIGILLLALLLDALSQRPAFHISRRLLQLVTGLGALSALFSCVSGYILKIQGDYEESLAGWHMWTGIGVLLLSLLLLSRIPSGKRDLLHGLVATSLFGLVLLAGHFGGSLTHGADYLSEAWSSEPVQLDTIGMSRPIANVQKALVYRDLVRPILMRRCVGCHGPNRQKGRLRLDDSVWINAGGKNGAVLIAHKPAQSELIKRIRLSMDDEQHMPPREKPQLKSGEIALLQWWVGQGADFNKSVGDLPQQGRIPEILQSLQAGAEGSAAGEEEDLVPSENVAAASPSMVEALTARNISVIPVARNSPYLSVNFVNLGSITLSDIALLVTLKNQLVALRLEGPQVGDSALLYISQCSRLRRLDLNGSRITDRGLRLVDSLHELRHLSLVGTPVTFEGVRGLQKIKTLKNLYLWKTQVSASQFLDLQKVFPKASIDSGSYQIPFFPKDTVNDLRR